MGSNFNFKNFGHDLQPGGGGSGSGGWPLGNFPIARQSSVYALTFDEFQSTVGGSGKDFGSMNMDELLKSIWNAEENQNIGSTSGGGVGGTEGGGYLQKQGSLTLPRTLSQKTVDEVWKDMSKEKDPNGGNADFGVPVRGPTLGEITLEEFLVRAGVVREEPQLAEKSSDVGIFSDFSRPVINSEIGFGYQPQNTNQIGIQSPILPLNVNGVRSAAQQPQQQQPQILPKNPALGYGAQMGITNNQLGSPRIRGGITGISDLAINNSMVQNSALEGMDGLEGNDVTVATGSPGISSNGLVKSNGDISSVSRVPYVLSSGLRGRKSAVLEKVVERRQRRMIKNRESAARSRARKQAYTTELEEEVAKLKEENEELRKKQEEIMKMQKNQVVEIINQRNGAKRQCLRRTQTVVF